MFDSGSIAFSWLEFLLLDSVPMHVRKNLQPSHSVCRQRSLVDVYCFTRMLFNFCHYYSELCLCNMCFISINRWVIILLPFVNVCILSPTHWRKSNNQTALCCILVCSSLQPTTSLESPRQPWHSKTIIP